MAKRDKAAAVAEQGVQDLTETFAGFAERGRESYEAALHNWSEGTHAFLEGMTRDGAEAFEKLQHCKSPMEALAVEQAWLMARATAYADAARRVFEAGVKAAPAAPNETPGFRLPD